jgi:hypothetical protein
MVKVPTGYHLVDEFSADMFYRRFDQILNMFHLFRLDASLCHLWALYQNYVVKDVAVVEPSYMHENNLRDCDILAQGLRGLI